MSHPILRLNDGFDHTSPELRDEVKVLQTELNQEGFALEADGLFGRDTESAVRRFRSLNDGFDHTSPELRDEVKVLQTELNQEGFALEADGLFGRDTESAVKRFIV